ncbi:MAG: Pre-rRNA-processing protein ipi3 [Cirrosporium novae-zelandiae]|nr:MAG: Pre-rRNA-processing protein ipi3 [Cirrosporium novae-zelandiae]
MLTESFIYSTLSSEKSAVPAVIKDAGIHIHELQPISATRASFKKSSTPPKCLAVSSSHVYAAQAEKAAVHVYNREKGNQETLIPFPEKIHSVVFAESDGGAGFLILGTEGGRVIVWEVCTGRQVTTQASHLQPVTCLSIDASSNFVLSGSADSNIHVWSLPNLLSFIQDSSIDQTESPHDTPVRTLSNHRAPITSLALGHSSPDTNIAISASEDNTCIVWSYTNGVPLLTYLLPHTPLCLTIEPADRGFCIGYSNGSIQGVDFYASKSLESPLGDASTQNAPRQLSPNDCHIAPDDSVGACQCLALSYDGSTLLSGHSDGKITAWDAYTGKYDATVSSISIPITNILMLPPSGFPNEHPPNLKLDAVIKPRYDHSLSDTTSTGGGNHTHGIPANYNFSAKFPTAILPSSSLSLSSAAESTAPQTTFATSLTHPSFPASILAAGLSELSTHSTTTTSYIPLPSSPDPQQSSTATELATLKAKLHAQTLQQKKLLAHLVDLTNANADLREKEEKMEARRREKKGERAREGERRREKVLQGKMKVGEVMMVDEDEDEDEDGGLSEKEAVDDSGSD